MTNASRLREAMAEDGCLAAPGVHDGLTALLAEKAGFRVAFLGGNAATASVLGLPDLGFLSADALIAHVRNICHVLRIPLLVDADTGFGGPLQVHRTVAALERAGAAAIMIEDQVPAKRCGLLDGGHPLVAAAEMAEKVRAATAARTDPDTVIIARTLAYSSGGIDEAIRRGRAYHEAGADTVFVQVPGTLEDLRAIRRSIPGPLVVNIDEALPASALNVRDAAKEGYKLALFPGTIRYTLVKAAGDALAALRQDGTTRGHRDRMASLADYHDVLRMGEFLDLEASLVKPS
ncbi:MAG: oxaloacetate decarboxylase [Deltaproteobacteria bacterium]|nr:oxaloacetate decarboxylase [Deltaproteobacteria bacterium]